ncbi:MAG: Holliday junction resolvase RuvX [Muribaculaceae bacterium]|nr:Holliday junction resolvase RuvX [Muribaculaceae bacterium]
MGRLMCIDYGRRRCGIAATDTLRIVATGITTVATAELIKFLKDYTSREPVDAIVIGRPVTLQGEPSESMRYITPAVARMRKEFPDMKFIFWDERFTSAIAHRAMIDGGMKKQARRDKAVVDRIAATIILNDYLQSRANNPGI